MRAFDAACLVFAIAGAAGVYAVKHEAELAHADKQALERDIRGLNHDVRLLEADLAALEQPVRLQAIIQSLPDTFDLQPITAAHYVRLEDIPFTADLAAVDPDDADVSDGLDGQGTADALGLAPELISAPGQIDLLLQVLNRSPDGGAQSEVDQNDIELNEVETTGSVGTPSLRVFPAAEVGAENPGIETAPEGSPDGIGALLERLP